MKSRLLTLVAGLVAVAGITAALAATTVVVTPTDEQGWSTADTRPGGAVTFVEDATAPGGIGALRLVTNATTTSKAQYMHAANTPLSSVTELGYRTKQASAAFAGGAPSFQIVAFLNGTTGFTTLVFEPYQNGTVVNGSWQSWDVDAGQFWSTRAVACSDGGVSAGGGGAPFYTLADVVSFCPDAVVIGFGVNIGSNNPSYDVRTDLVVFNGTTYDFEPYIIATSKDDCKNGGWENLTDADGASFNNQGDCVSYVTMAT